VVDLGGDDTYEAPVGANQDARNPVSVLVDLGGDDTYGYPVVPSSARHAPRRCPRMRMGGARGAGPASMSRTARQGAGRLGVGLFYDLGAGRDRYRSLRMSQGFGALGVGGLYDEGGDDTYEAEAGGQGSAMAGVGVLVDGGGRDAYTRGPTGRASATCRASGSLSTATATTRTRRGHAGALPVAQSPMTNSSFAQGAGFGRRGDAFPDRINMSGGIGVLRDRAGNDRYTASVFRQGTGYWGGMGLLLDGAGDDRYDAPLVRAGGSAHFAYAALVDGGGRDVHNAMATRQEHDRGRGARLLPGRVERSGPEGDTTACPTSRSARATPTARGSSPTSRRRRHVRGRERAHPGQRRARDAHRPGRLMRPTVGIFLDADGRDTYTRAPAGPVGEGRVWSQRIHPEAPSERGFGADATGARTGLEAP
jgi:hypothetical protein